MPYVFVNQARLYYRIYGRAAAGRTPVLLIHGSTVTGQADWGEIAPLLARHGPVIVPDCRGHGRSTNPERSYRFRQMADDLVGLLRALGCGPAHIIGHSNGGNVALVLLMEHPEAVRSAVLQAANAYVSPDLIAKEPHVFDPERVQREAPGWMRQMIALHGRTHGRQYWRELLQLTVQEIISQPNYTPAELAQVQRPVLVIQGEHDQVNAPARHAQFIARHIPFAELWLPEGVGHNVHQEIPLRWLERVGSFLERRGTPANEALHRLKIEHYADSRITVFDLQAVSASAGRRRSALPVLQGSVLTTEQLSHAVQVLQLQNLQLREPITEVKVLLGEETPWALVNRPVTDLRRAPRNLAERVSQALLGEIVRVLEEGPDGWVFVRLEHDGYLGWLHTAALQPCTQSEALAYRQASLNRVIAPWVPAFDPSGTEPLQKLPFGVLVPVESWQGNQAMVVLPDGQRWRVAAEGLLKETPTLTADAEGIRRALQQVRGLIGVPYLWGGRTPYGFDCSGLAQAFWHLLGVQLPRDADQQAQIGQSVSTAPEAGDLLFFGAPDPDQPQERYRSISHVAISLGGAQLIHANGSTWSIAVNSLDPNHPLYRPWLREHLLEVRRYR